LSYAFTLTSPPSPSTHPNPDPKTLPLQSHCFLPLGSQSSPRPRHTTPHAGLDAAKAAQARLEGLHQTGTVPTARQLAFIELRRRRWPTRGLEAGHIRDFHSGEVLQGDDAGGGELPADQGHPHPGVGLEVAAEPARAAGLGLSLDHITSMCSPGSLAVSRQASFAPVTGRWER